MEQTDQSPGPIAAVNEPADPSAALQLLQDRLDRLRGLCGEVRERDAGLAAREHTLRERELALEARERTLARLTERLRELQHSLSGEPAHAAPAAADSRRPAPASDRGELDRITRERDELRDMLRRQEELLRRAGLEIEWAPEQPASESRARRRR